MERKIEFRGYAKDFNSWVYGGLIIQNEKCYIICEIEVSSMDAENTDLYAIDWYEVYPNSVGQYTGKEDKNKVEIYSDDLVTVPHYLDGRKKIIGVVTYIDYEFVVDVIDMEMRLSDAIEVMGNKYENGDLLHELLYQGKSVEEVLERLKDNENI